MSPQSRIRNGGLDKKRMVRGHLKRQKPTYFYFNKFSSIRTAKDMEDFAGVSISIYYFVPNF